ncbi:MAG: hypothetical protein EA350_08035 [Gemmatimonadales bacterium]|nr:MAG: hypothetical protein EA350_08035 [Gemmatimonadales bacterium]
MTGTPLARTKRLARWPAHLVEVDRIATVRAGSRAAGIHPSTGFRWRHRILETVSSRAIRPWASTAVLHRHALPFVEPAGMGSHGTISSRFYPPPHGRARKGRFWIVGVVGRDRDRQAGGLHLGALGRDRRSWLSAASGRFTDFVGAQGTVWAHEGPLGPTAVRARRKRFRYRSLAPSGDSGRWGACGITGAPLHRDAAAARSACEGFRRWIGRFRGVSARYADHYLQWRLLGRRDLMRPAGVSVSAGPIPFRRGIRILACLLQP